MRRILLEIFIRLVVGFGSIIKGTVTKSNYSEVCVILSFHRNQNPWTGQAGRSTLLSRDPSARLRHLFRKHVFLSVVIPEHLQLLV